MFLEICIQLVLFCTFLQWVNDAKRHHSEKKIFSMIFDVLAAIGLISVALELHNVFAKVVL